MKVFAVVNHKGGVGKTTTVISLASIFALGQERTLVIDLDPHASLSSSLAHDPDGTKGGSALLFEKTMRSEPASLDELVRPTGLENLYLLPASTSLATMERRGAGTSGLGLVLREALAKCQTRYDRVLIDTAPTLGVLMVNALAACEQIIIPAQTDYLSIRGLDMIERTLDRMRRSRGWELPSLIVPTFYDRRTKAAKNGLEDLQRRYHKQLWRDVIPIDSGIRNASAQGIPYPVYNRRGRAAKAYAALAADLSREGAVRSIGNATVEEDIVYA